jgi:DnaJ-class molecular chaperone
MFFSTLLGLVSLFFGIFCQIVPCAVAFATVSVHTRQPLTIVTRSSPTTRLSAARVNQAVKKDSFLLDDFKTANGELIEPYKVLKVGRGAEKSEIKKAYRELSRRYHPDGVRYRDLLPGSCNNLDDVRDHWERIKLSYEILSDPKMRIKYDRNTTIADPKAALGRAALGAVGWGLAGVGKGLFKMGEAAVGQLTKERDDPKPTTEKDNSPNGQGEASQDPRQ